MKLKNCTSTECMATIQDSKQLDMNTLLGLQNRVFVDAMTYFCDRGR